MKKYKNFEIKLIRVYDGDTIIADIGLGFDLWLSNQKIRLARINAPEMEVDNLPNPLGEKSKTYLENLLSNKVLKIETNCKKEKFGRWLCEVIIVASLPEKRLLEALEKNVSTLMIESGNAVAYRGLDLNDNGETEESEEEFYKF